MEIQFVKNHLGYKSGEKAEVTQERANYFIRTGVAVKYVKPKPKVRKEGK